MLVERRHIAPRGLDAEHVAIDLRTPELRVGLNRGRNVASDYALLAKATPFLDRHPVRTAVTIVLDGKARFEEGGRRIWLEPGDIVVSDGTMRGTSLSVRSRARRDDRLERRSGSLRVRRHSTPRRLARVRALDRARRSGGSRTTSFGRR